MKINDYRDLKVWQLAMDVAERVYILSGTFPHHQQYTLVSQMQRACISVPSNIVEGHSRHSTKDFLRYLAIAQGSRAELETQLRLAIRLTYCAEAKAAPLVKMLDELGRMLSSLQKSLRAKL